MTSKVKIEASSMAKHLMTMYESGQFSNTIKARKENFDFPPGSYCASIIACNAEKTFLSNMGPILKAGEGMDERWFYLYQPDPKTWPVNKDYVFVNTVVGAQETKKRIEKAVQQGVFEIEDFFGLLDKMAAVNNRIDVYKRQARNDLGMKPAVALVPVLFRSYPFAVFQVVRADLRLVKLFLFSGDAGH